MSDKKEEKSEWDEEIPVSLPKEDYDNGDLVPLPKWIDPEKYKRLEEECDRLLKEKKKLETEIKALRDQNALLVAEKVAEAERIGNKSSKKGGFAKYLIIAFLVVFGIVSYKLYDKIQKLEERSNVAITTVQSNNNASLKAQLEAEKSAREKAEAAKEEEERKRKAAEAKAAELKNKQEEAAKEKEAERQRKAADALQSAARQYKVGDKITFGSYPFYEDGRTKAIDWIILDIDEDNALVISDYALDNVSYNKEFVEITWEESTIKQWLNETFINKAFTPEQRSKIIKSRIANKDNAEYKTRGGEDIYDKLFLLSIEEVMKYFKDDESRIAYPTPYAKSSNSVNGYLYQSTSHVRKDRGGSCWWWLRSPGYHQNNAADIGSVGKLNSKGVDVNSVNGAVRPAFRINLNNL